MKGDPRRADETARALADLMPCFACGAADLDRVADCARPGCALPLVLKGSLEECKAQRETREALEHGRLWGCSQGDRVQTRWGLGTVSAVVVEHAMSRRLEVLMDQPGKGEQIRHVFRAGDVRRVGP